MEKKQRVEISCAACGESFSLLPCQMKNGRGKYCSKSCRDEARRNGGKVRCSRCRKTVYRKACEQEDGRAYFCSRVCYMEQRDETAMRTTYRKIGKRHAHRVIAEACLGRSLRKGEIVHHKDGDARNNRPSNLAVMPSQAVHARCHFGDMTDAELDGYSLAGAAS